MDRTQFDKYLALFFKVRKLLFDLDLDSSILTDVVNAALSNDKLPARVLEGIDMDTMSHIDFHHYLNLYCEIKKEYKRSLDTSILDEVLTAALDEDVVPDRILELITFPA